MTTATDQTAAEREAGPCAAGGVLRGEGFIIKNDGRKIPFSFTSDPLTREQAEKLNSAED
jgi:hypothetical protein